MPPGIGAGVAVADPLMVLGGAERDDGLAVDDREEARLPRRSMNSSMTTAPPASPKPPSNIASSAAARFRRALGDDHALAGGEPVRLDHHRQAEILERGLGREPVGGAGVARGRNAMAGAQILGEALRAFELGRHRDWGRRRRCPSRADCRRGRRPEAPPGRSRRGRSPWRRQKSTTARWSAGSSAASSACSAMPGLPGAA